MKFSVKLGPLALSFGKTDQPATPPPPLIIPAAPQRNYAAAAINRLTADWHAPQTNADAEIAGSFRQLVGRTRGGERDNEYVGGYLTLLDNNVLGADGVKLQMKIADPGGSPDDMANRIVADGWDKWGERANCSVSGAYCWREIEGLVLRRAACDGGIFVRMITGWNNPWRFALQPLEIDHLDIDMNARLNNGNQIRFGIEFNPWHRPIAYHLFNQHPGELFGPTGERMRIPASELLHIFWSERPGQSIGVPWLSNVMQLLEHLGKYREAELVASRVAACQGYAITQEKQMEWTGETDSTGKQLQAMEPGMGMRLDAGEGLQNISPTHPNTAFPDFVKGALRGIARGLGINYNSLANDLESVNYSSMRAGKLEEMEEYKSIQSWLIESLHAPIFSAWLENSLVFGALKTGTGASLSASKFNKFNAATWKPRRWPWVDPLKDMQAAVLAVEKGFKSRRSIIAEMGGDIEEVFAEQAQDNDLAAENGLEFPTGAEAKASVDTPQNDEMPAMTPRR